MKLPEIFETRGGMHSLHHLRIAAFACAVIHDGNARMKGVYQHLRIRASLSVMQTQKHVNNANPVVGAHQLKFLVLGQVPQMNGAKLSKRDKTPTDCGSSALFSPGLKLAQ